MNATGPDLSCDISRRLDFNTTYVVGICGPVGEWSPLSTYRSKELELLRSLKNDTTRCSGTILISPNVMLLGLAVITFMWGPGA